MINDESCICNFNLVMTSTKLKVGGSIFSHKLRIPCVYFYFICLYKLNRYANKGDNFYCDYTSTKLLDLTIDCFLVICVADTCFEILKT